MARIVCGMQGARGEGNRYPLNTDPGHVSPWIARIPRKIARSRVGINPAISPFMIRSVLVDQAATLLGVSRRTVYYRIREGRLRTVRTRCGSQRVLVESIEALLAEEVSATVPGADVSDTGLSGKYQAT